MLAGDLGEPRRWALKHLLLGSSIPGMYRPYESKPGDVYRSKDRPRTFAPHRGLNFQSQYRRKPARCHRTKVSGRTMASASRAFRNNWQTQPRTIMSTAKNGTRLGLPRCSTMICYRNTRISASTATRGRNRSITIPKISMQRSNILQRIIGFCVSRQPDGIYDRDSHSAPRAYRRAALCLVDSTITMSGSNFW
jgi:hypothetical protein